MRHNRHHHADYRHDDELNKRKHRRTVRLVGSTERQHVGAVDKCRNEHHRVTPDPIRGTRKRQPGKKPQAGKGQRDADDDTFAWFLPTDNELSHRHHHDIETGQKCGARRRGAALIGRKKRDGLEDITGGKKCACSKTRIERRTMETRKGGTQWLGKDNGKDDCGNSKTPAQEGKDRILRHRVLDEHKRTAPDEADD